MNTQKQFVVPSSRHRSPKNIWSGFVFATIAQVMVFGWFSLFSTYPVFRGAGCWYVLAIMVGVSLVNNILLLRKAAPAAIFDATGITVKDFGLIPWENIEKVALYALPFMKSFKFVGIRCKDVAAVRAQASWAGKLKLLSPKFFGDYHLTLAHTHAVSSTEIVLFAQHYQEAHAQSKLA
jgi:membrane protein YdbS with pleckstrin-like domain